MLDFTNKTIIITGASRGIGEASANYFSNLNANVVLAARSKSKIAEIADKLGKNALAIECNVADPTQVNNLMVKSSKVFGTIDVLINNAGIIDPIQRIEHSDPVAWGQLIDTNLKGLYYGIRYALPFMKSNNGGTILNVGSGAAKTPLEGWSHYCSSKVGGVSMAILTYPAGCHPADHLTVVALALPRPLSQAFHQNHYSFSLLQFTAQQVWSIPTSPSHSS
jgi:NADP-dependent 3-hydroxy acid dehydrogenase YdfG